MADETPDEQDVFKRPFIDFLRELNRGATSVELTNKLNELNHGIKETGKKGSLVLTVTVEPSGKNNTDVLLVTAVVNAKIPRPAERQSSFFLNDDGNLVTSDPRQLAFETIQVVEAAGPLTNIKDVSA